MDHEEKDDEIATNYYCKNYFYKNKLMWYNIDI